MNGAKIHLSAEELELMQNADVILTKNRIVQKVSEQFALLSEEMMDYWMKSGLQNIIQPRPPKISRGENYQGLPYVVLDVVRVFERERIFAIRHLFWWGRYFSITLHLRGSFRDQFFSRLVAAESRLAGAGYYLSVSSEEWVHAIDEPDYRALGELGGSGMPTAAPDRFVKISAKIPLGPLDSMAPKMMEEFRLIVDVLAS